MFRIGDFSALAQVSVKTLHHYDDIGLLRPAHTSPQTGYRYYTAEQFPRLTQIRTLRELGFSLEEIAFLIDHPAERLAEHLTRKREETAARLHEEQVRLLRIEQLLNRDADRQYEAFRFPISMKALLAQTVVGVRATLELSEWRPDVISEEIARRLTILYGLLSERRVRPVGPPITLWHNREWSDNSVDLEAAVPIAVGAERLRDAGASIQVHTLPEVPQAACVIYQKTDQQDDTGAAYLRLVEALGEQDLQIAGIRRSVTLHYDPATRARTVEVQFPVEKRSQEQ